MEYLTRTFNKIGLFTIFFISFIACKNENEIPDYLKKKLSKVWLYNIDGTTKISLEHLYKYDDKGRIDTVFNSLSYKNNQIIDTSFYDVYSFNSNNELAKISMFVKQVNETVKFTNIQNLIFTYNNGLRTKELTEFPIINRYKYINYSYQHTTLIKSEIYEDWQGLVSSIIYEYNDKGQLIKEITVYPNSDNYDMINHTYTNNLLTKSEEYYFIKGVGNKIRERYMEYNSDNLLENKITYEAPFSSRLSHILKYEYFK